MIDTEEVVECNGCGVENYKSSTWECRVCGEPVCIHCDEEHKEGCNYYA